MDKKAYENMFNISDFYRNVNQNHNKIPLHTNEVKSLSRVRLLATSWTAAYQSPPSLGFFRQEHWSGLLFPSPVHTVVYSENEVAKLCPTLCDPMDCSQLLHPWDFPGKNMEWVAISFFGGSS